MSHEVRRLHPFFYFLLLVLLALFVSLTSTVEPVSHFRSHVSGLHWPAREGQSDSIPSASPSDAAGNSTLGFEKILALSLGTPWRVNGLQAAANYTNISISIPPQPPKPAQLVDAFAHLGRDQLDGKGRPDHGSTLAWLAHLDMLKYVIQSGYASVLIVEDDVDWDVEVKAQMRMVSDGVRRYYNTTVDHNDRTPYGSDSSSSNSSSWDVLWLGHCGDYHTSPRQTTWPDNTTIPVSQYQGPVRQPDGQRMLQTTMKGTICTFAYAVSRAGARKVAEALGAGHGLAFDCALADACMAKKLECLNLNPEVFHQYEPAKADVVMESEVGAANAGSRDAEEGGGGAAAAAAAAEAEPVMVKETHMHMGSTKNIVNSARCRALFDSQCIAKH